MAPDQLNPSAIAGSRETLKGSAANHLDELTKTACSRCQNQQLVLWTNSTEQLCEKCFTSYDSPSRPGSSGFQMLFCPRMLSDGTLGSDRTISFSVLREFVEKCMRPLTAANIRELLVGSPEAIGALIEHLESKIILPNINPAFVARSEKIMLLRKSLQKQREELGSLSTAIRELKLKMSRDNNMADRKFLKREAKFLRNRAKAKHKQVEIEQFAQRIEKLETELASILEVQAAKIQTHAVERLRHEFTQWQRGDLDFEFHTPIHHVYWELLKPSGNSWEELVRHYEYLQRTRNDRYELERLKQIHDLGPERIYIGLASFEGYVVFSFTPGDVAVLDCPQVGNALYVMTNDKWKILSQLSKTELLICHQHEAQRIIHGWHWFHELKTLLEDRGVLGRKDI